MRIVYLLIAATIPVAFAIGLWIFQSAWVANEPLVLEVSLAEAKIVVNRKIRDNIDNPYIYYEIYDHGDLKAGPQFLWTEHEPLVHLCAATFPNEGLLTIYLRDAPDVVVLAYDIQTGDIYPSWDMKVRNGEDVKRRLLAKISEASNRHRQFANLFDVRSHLPSN